MVFQAVRLWFQNYGRKNKRSTRAKYTKKKNWYNVAASQYKEDIKRIMEEKHPELDTQSPQYLAEYQHCLKELTDDLSDDERENLKSIAATWNETGPAEEVKKRSVLRLKLIFCVC